MQGELGFMSLSDLRHGLDSSYQGKLESSVAVSCLYTSFDFFVFSPCNTCIDV